MYIFVSKIRKEKGSGDYASLLKAYTPCPHEMKNEGKTINFKWDKDKKTIVIDGEELSDSIKKPEPGTYGNGGAEQSKSDNSNAFCDYFMAGDDEFKQDDKTEEKLVAQLHDIITNIVTETKIESIGQEDQENCLFIHWGGAGREIYSTRLRNAANKIGGFPFDIIEFSSTDDIKSEKFGGKSVYEVLTTKDSSVGNWDNIKEAIQILIDQSKIYSRRIYELMESIYIKGFVNYEGSETLTLNDNSIIEEAKWLRDKSKEVLTSLQSKEMQEQEIQDKIIELYDQTDNFKNFITLKDDDNLIEIKDLMGFREKINELLSILPFDIYSREL